jgi:hypothetical protein
LRADWRGNEQEKNCGVEQGGLGRDKAQMDSPGSAGDAWRTFYRDHGRWTLDGSATTFGQQAAAWDEQAARMPTGRMATFHTLGAVTAVTVFCEIGIPVPGLADALQCLSRRCQS